MSLNISIYLPNQSIEDSTIYEDLVTEAGDIVAKYYGNNVTEEEQFTLSELNSFIIISESDIPEIKNLEGQDCFLIIPIEENYFEQE